MTIDLTGMYAAHDSFRRDLDRLAHAAERGPDAFAAVRGGWQNFVTQLLVHHRAEDEALWPRLRARLARPEDLRLLDEMEMEHAVIDPLIEKIEQSGGDADHVSRFAEALRTHLAHEEREALPLIRTALTPDDWAAFTGHIRREQGMKGAAVYLPWVLDGEVTEAQRTFVAGLPAPPRLLNKLVWQRRYRRRQLWS